MKQYKLKKWYPSLAISWRTDDRYEYDAYRQVMINISNVKNGLALPKEMIVKKQELNPDFWELIEEEKPLFVTEDGVDIFLGHSYILIDKEFIKHKQTASNMVYTEYFKKFKHESNADKYIWRNKRVFSYEEIAERASQTELYYLETLAIERSKL